MGEKRKREESNIKIEEEEKEQQEQGGWASEDYCFVCKDGGFLTVCDHKECVKAYHLECVGKKEDDEEDNNWTCVWHSCLVCRKSSEYQCYCCPNAVCQRCYKDAAFARVRGNKGFCHDCVRLALLGEEGIDVDSDGEKVDFKDPETYECLFKEYWDIIKEKEGLVLEDLHNADAQIEKSKNYTPHSHKSRSNPLSEKKTKCDSKKYVKAEEKKEEHKGSSSGNRDIDNVVVQPIVEINKTKPKRAPRPKRKVSERIEFVGWASKSLMEFLESIGVDASKKLSQHDVASLVIKYVQEKNLLHPDKNNVALCDGRLRSLLGRKLFDMHKINEVLEPHFAEILEHWEDEGPQCRKKGMLSFRNKDVVVKVVYSQFATVVPENMRLVYLRRTLVGELLEHHETFESKVVGSFVKVKSNPFDSKHPYHLLRVTGVKEISGDGNKEKIHLQVCSVANDIPISSLSNDDDISQEDCDNLRQKIDKGLVEKPTVVELEEKAKGLHKDITKHWITRELSSLENRIELANEKGRRAELCEYRKRRDLLQSETEQARLLIEVPKVIADVVEIIPEEPQPDDNPKNVKKLKEKKPLYGDRCIVLSLPANRGWKKFGVSPFQNRGSLIEKFRQQEVILEDIFKKDTFEKVVYSHFATVTPENLKVVYLRRSLVEQLLEYHETFESKVVGSFVKVKSDSLDSKHPYHLLPVIGVKKDSGDENNKKILLQVSSVVNDIPISSLSNDDISQEDCDNLRQRIDNGLVEKPIVVELEVKAKCLHEDITKHWITSELSILRNSIDVANEKGRRAKLFEYRKRKELLESEEEQARLLNEVPKVIPDVIEINPEELLPDVNPENVENPIQEFNEKLPRECKGGNASLLNEMSKVIADLVEIKPNINSANVITVETPIEEFREKLSSKCNEGNVSLLNEMPKVIADVVEIKSEEPQPDVNLEKVIMVENPIEEFKEKLLGECKEGNASLLNEMPKVIADVVEIKPEEPQPDIYPENVITVENSIEEFKEKLPRECKEDNASFPSTKEPGWRNNGVSLFQQKEAIPEDVAVYSHFASVVLENMRLVYLRRSLVEQLLEFPETFESKIVGSFVKVKSEPFDRKHPYHLLPVIGVKKVSGDGKKEKILLRVTSVANDIHIFSLSNDDDVSKEECDNLHQKAENGLVEKPTVAELEEKAKRLHEDITKHRITRELSILCNRIDLANEKGRRAELYECRKRRELLQSEREQARLLNEVPKVIADVVENKRKEPQPDAINVENANEEFTDENVLAF